jgi:hypothetical protein
VRKAWQKERIEQPLVVLHGLDGLTGAVMTPLIGRRQLGANAGRDGSPKLVPVAIASSDPHRFARIWGNTSLVPIPDIPILKEAKAEYARLQ